MSNAGEYVGWLGVTIVVPIVVPFLVLWAADRAYDMPREARIYRLAVKDGQLLWIAISLAAAAIFDAAGFVRNAPVVGWSILVWNVCVLVMSAILVSMWTIGSIGAAGPLPSVRLKEDSLMSFSILLLVAAALSYAAMKWFL